MPENTRKIFLHIIGILAFLSIPVFTSPDFDSGKNLIFISGFRRNFASYLLMMLFFYANYYFFIPKYYFAKRTFLYVSILAFCYAVILVAPNFLLGHERPTMPMNMPPGATPPGPIMMLEGGSVIQFLLVLSLSILLRTNNQLREINSEKLKAEVSYLKAQINPHFLFNTLNSLYALTIEKSDDAPDAVLKLSNMMRYVVTESTSDFVPLEKEISYITDYIDMQRLRVTDETHLEYLISGNPKGKSIAPLVIMPFIENAFKYGINPEENWHISIAIGITDNDFTLDVKNNKVNVSIPGNYASEQGIENTAKRLRYIYPGKHELKLDDQPGIFHAHLKISFT